MDTRKSSAAIDGTRSSVAAEIKSANLQSGKSSVGPEVCNAVLDWMKAISALRGRRLEVEPAGRKSNVTGARSVRKKSLAANHARGRQIHAAKELSLGFASSFPAVMPLASDAPSGPPAFPQEAIPALRLHFQSSRAEYVERRLNAHNVGVVGLYCKLCLRLIVASRDEFVFPIAVKTHKCGRGRDTRSQMARW